MKTCSNCAARKSPAPKNRAPLQSVKVGCPMQLVAVDILGPFPESEEKNQYILVVGDYFTRWMEAYPIRNQEAVTVAKKLTDEFFFRFSPPEQLHSDQGRQFESELVAEVCKLLGIHKSRTTPYHPQSDGMIERFNRTLLSMLATAASENPFDWEDHLRPLCMAYNTSIHPTTGYTPFLLMFGRQARMPVEVMYGTPSGEDTSPSDYATTLRKQLETAYRRVREQMGQKLNRQKEFYDEKKHGQPYSQGELVWLHSPAIPRGQARKLHRPWTGPYKILRRLSDSNYRIQDVQSRRRRYIVHFDRLKHCPPDVRLPQLSPHNHSSPNPSAPAPPRDTTDNFTSTRWSGSSSLPPPRSSAPILPLPCCYSLIKMESGTYSS